MLVIGKHDKNDEKKAYTFLLKLTTKIRVFPWAPYAVVVFSGGCFSGIPHFSIPCSFDSFMGADFEGFFSGACKAYQTGGIKSRHGKTAIKVISRKFFNSRVFFMHREPGHP